MMSRFGGRGKTPLHELAAERMDRRMKLPKTPQAGFAKARFVRLMKGMGIAATIAVAITWTLFYRELGFVSIHFYIATGLGVAFATMLMGALMGLVFLSSGSGHDESMAGGGQESEVESGTDDLSR